MLSTINSFHRIFCILSDCVFSLRNEKKLNRKEISDSVASAMASKIASDAKQYRKNRENYNYLNSKVEKKE